jgi:competence protein ComEC
VGQPLLKVTLCYVAGLLLAEWFPLPWQPVLLGALAVGVVSLAWSRAREGLIALLLILTGCANLLLHTAVISPHDLRSLLQIAPAEVAVRGVLLELPRERAYDFDDETTWRTLAQVRVEALKKGNSGWEPAFGIVAASTRSVLPGLWQAGQRVQVRGVLTEPPVPIAEGLFDYRTYLQRQGIHYQLRANSSNDWMTLPPVPGPSLTTRFTAWAKKNLARGLPIQDEPLHLLWAMVLGWQTALTGEVSEPFMRSGTMHVFAISGLHIALIAGILVAVLRVVRVPQVWCGAVVIPLIWFYTAATGWQPSAIRSTIMMSVIIGGWALRRPSDLLNSLAGAAFVILLWDPQQIFQASFQLSFFVVLSLALVAPVLQKLWEQRFRPDPFLPDHLRSRLWHSLRPATRHLSGAVITSGAAWLGSIPLVAFYFHFFTPVSLLANLVVVPLSSAALASALGSLCCGGWFPALAELFNHSAWLFMWLMIRVSEWAADLPGACFNIPAPSLLGFTCYYGILVSVLAGWWRMPRVRIWMAVPLGALSLAWAVSFVIDSRQTRLTVIPLSGGHAVYYDAPGWRDDLLVDCGNESSVEFVLKPWLRARGVNRLATLVLTHGDKRQIGGAILLHGSFPVKRVVSSPLVFRSADYRLVLDEFRISGVPTQTIDKGGRLGRWIVLHPQSQDRFAKADDGALVLQADFAGQRVLLLSDLGRIGQRLLSERVEDLAAQTVVSGLSESGEGLAAGFLQRIQPRTLVVADCEYPATGRANRTLQERLRSIAGTVLYTRQCGAVTLRWTGREWEIQNLCISNRAAETSPHHAQDSDTAAEQSSEER